MNILNVLGMGIKIEQTHYTPKYPNPAVFVLCFYKDGHMYQKVIERKYILSPNGEALNTIFEEEVMCQDVINYFNTLDTTTPTEIGQRVIHKEKNMIGDVIYIYNSPTSGEEIVVIQEVGGDDTYDAPKRLWQTCPTNGLKADELGRPTSYLDGKPLEEYFLNKQPLDDKLANAIIKSQEKWLKEKFGEFTTKEFLESQKNKA
jgi:hypothetical protein